MKVRGFRKRMTHEAADAIMEKAKTEKPLELERGDLGAMILAAIIVYVPFLLLFGGALGFVWWFIFYVWGR